MRMEKPDGMMREKKKLRGGSRKRYSESMASRAPRRLRGFAGADFRDFNVLRRFLTEQGKLMPARYTGATAKQQRQIARAVRRARAMGFVG